jgi:hypothetical protein
MPPVPVDAPAPVDQPPAKSVSLPPVAVLPADPPAPPGAALRLSPAPVGAPQAAMSVAAPRT